MTRTISPSDALLELAERCEAATGADRLPERIRSRLQTNDAGCWEWTSPNSLVGRGRGYVSIGGKPMLHHRAVWTLLRGPIPKGAFLCHHCDNPKCANPDHLYVGNSKSNVADMFARGRHWTQRDPQRAKLVAAATGHKNTWARGAGNPKARLTPEQVEQIKTTGGSSYAVARQFGVDATTIQRIRNRATWN